ncbi:MAG: cytochrome d ubiquinol oxidase subunit II [Trueperella sp.]|nr:cytochrome d ubiquinol oxidase subunit II [Trueperella sp.]
MDLSFLQILWFILIIVLWIGYVTLEGFGFGVGMLLPILPKNEKERRLALNTIGPHWDGNEVFLLTAGGATFAAFPNWYATMFSGMYAALVAVLLLLIVRISALEWRGKLNSARWRRTWDTLHTVVAWLAAVVWGVAFANLVQGMDIKVGSYVTPGGEFVAVPPEAVEAGLAEGARHYLTGGFVSLFTPFTIVGGVMVALLFLTHGALWLSIKTRGEFHDRAQGYALKLSVASTVVTAGWALWAQFGYSLNWWSLIPLAIAAICLVAAVALIFIGKDVPAFFLHFAGLAGAVVFIFTTFFPNALKSSADPAYSLTLVQASATAPTHTVMLIAAAIFVPIVLIYLGWSYSVFARRISVDNLSDQPAGLHPDQIREFETVK